MIFLKNITYTIKDSSGVHARPAGMLVKTAGKFKSDINIESGGKSANAKKLFAVMGLNIKCGQSIVISASGEDEDEALKEIKSFFESNL